MKAIIKLGLTNDLVIIDDKVVIGILPLGDDILNEVKDQLMCMKAGTITELNFIVTPTVIKEYDNMFVTDGLPIGKLNCEIDYTCVLDRDDLDKFRQLASYLNIDKINIYNIFLHNYKLFLQNIKLHFCHFKYKGNKFTVIKLCKPIPFIFTKLFYIIL